MTLFILILNIKIFHDNTLPTLLCEGDINKRSSSWLIRQREDHPRLVCLHGSGGSVVLIDQSQFISQFSPATIVRPIKWKYWRQYPLHPLHLSPTLHVKLQFGLDTKKHLRYFLWRQFPIIQINLSVFVVFSSAPSSLLCRGTACWWRGDRRGGSCEEN